MSKNRFTKQSILDVWESSEYASLLCLNIFDIKVSLSEREDVSTYRSSRLEVFYKNVFLKASQNPQENTCGGVSS